jgi:Sulfate permease family
MRPAAEGEATLATVKDDATGSAKGGKKPLPGLQGILPIDKPRVSTDILAGITLAALGIPEVMGYASIAGMPVVTGLYTILIPIAVFALLGSSSRRSRRRCGRSSPATTWSSCSARTLSSTRSPR